MKTGVALILVLLVLVSGCSQNEGSRGQPDFSLAVEDKNISNESYQNKTGSGEKMLKEDIGSADSNLPVKIPETGGFEDAMEDENSMFDIMKSMMGGDSGEIEKFVEHNFIDLDRIQRISKFRSGYGHDYSYGSGETCRSMKHYFWPKGGDPEQTHSPSWMSVKYFAPVDGAIRFVRETKHEYGTESQFLLMPDENARISFQFFHVKLKEGLGEGSRVKAGQEIGTIGHENSHGEIAVQNGFEPVSFFDVISDHLFESYKKRGLVSVEDVKISKGLRDSKPLKCDPNTEEGRFIGVSIDGLKDSTGLDNWFNLN